MLLKTLNANLLALPLVFSGVLLGIGGIVVSLDFLTMLALLFWLFLTVEWKVQVSLAAVACAAVLLVILFGLQLAFIEIKSIANFVGSYIKLTYLLLLAYLLAACFIKRSFLAIKIIEASIFLSAFFLVYDFFFPMFIDFNEVTYIAISDFPRPRGVHAEPSFYATFCGILYIFRKQLKNASGNCSTQNFDWHVIVLVLSLTLTLSITASLIATFIIFDSMRVSVRTTQLVKFLILGCFFLVSIYWFAGEYLISRILDFSGDGSIVTRSFGSYYALTYTLNNSPLIGFGPGGEQFSVAAGSVGSLNSLLPSQIMSCALDQSCGYELRLSTNNLLVNSYFSFGVLGIIFFLFGISVVYRSVGFWCSLCFVCILFSRGDLFFLYTYIAIFVAIKMVKNEKENLLSVSV